jgi:hypothetical protein
MLVTRARGHSTQQNILTAHTKLGVTAALKPYLALGHLGKVLHFLRLTACLSPNASANAYGRHQGAGRSLSPRTLSLCVNMHTWLGRAEAWRPGRHPDSLHRHAGTDSMTCV